MIILRYTTVRGRLYQQIASKTLVYNSTLAAYPSWSIFSGLNGHFRISRGVLVLRSKVMVSAPRLPNAHAYYCPAPPLSFCACAYHLLCRHVNEVKVHRVAADQVSVHGVCVCVKNRHWARDGALCGYACLYRNSIMSAALICLLVSIIFPSGVLVVSSTSPSLVNGWCPRLAYWLLL